MSKTKIWSKLNIWHFLAILLTWNCWCWLSGRIWRPKPVFQLICKGLSPLTRHFMTGRSAWWSVGLMLAVCSEGKFPKEGGTERVSKLRLQPLYSTLTLLVGHYFRMSYHQRRGRRVCFCLIRYHYWLGRGSHPRENPWHLRWSNFH